MTITNITIGKILVGWVSDETFYKTILGSKHLLRRPRAIAFDVSTLEDAEEAGARFVDVKDNETGTIYRTHIKMIWLHGFKLNRGFGDQQALPLEYWLINETLSDQLSMQI